MIDTPSACKNRKNTNLCIIFRQWEHLGVEVRMVTNVLNSIENIQKLLNEANVSGPVEGIHLIATDSMNTDAEENSDNSTVRILDVVSRELCTRLR